MAASGKNGLISFNRFGYKFKGEGPFQRVTTIKSKLSTGDALTDWAARMVAVEAARIGSALADGTLDAASAAAALQDEALQKAHRTVRDSAADFGTIFHELVESYTRGDQDVLHAAEVALVRAVTVAAFERARPKVEPSKLAVSAWMAGLDAYELQLFQAELVAAKERLWPDVQAFIDWESTSGVVWERQEFQVFNRRLNYAGSCDALVTVGGRRYILDVKTSKGVYKDYGLQLAAYRYAEFIGHADGTEEPMPKTVGGLILHIHDGACRLLEVDCGPQVFEAFEACATLYRFSRYADDPVTFKAPAPVSRPAAPAIARVAGDHDDLARALAEVFA